MKHYATLKSKGLKNDFDRDELARWWSHSNVCWYCGRWHADCFHHVLGRKSDSLLNAASLNNFECHLPIHGKIRRRETIVRFLSQTLRHLLSQGYELNENDRKFIEKHIGYYRELST